MVESMEQEEHLEYLKKKYVELSRQFLAELNEGKSIHMLKGLSSVMETLIKEISDMEAKIRSRK